MSKTRESVEGRIVNFFNDAPLEVADVVYHIVCDTMRRRKKPASFFSKIAKDKVRVPGTASERKRISAASAAGGGEGAEAS